MQSSYPEPRIGISTGLREGRVSVPGAYLSAITRAGGLAVVIAPGVEAPPRGGWAARLDGLLLSGGVDIGPARYGEEAHPKTEVDPERDALEFALVRDFFAAGKPILGICRGIQILNVALGGTLVQHIPDLEGIVYAHSDAATLHPLDIAEDSFLSRIFPVVPPVNSTHHQAVGKLAQGLRAVAWCDGLIEAVEGAGCRGVQWHPERMGAAMAPLFDGFVSSCSVKG